MTTNLFQAIDRNNDGYISKGELKLARKKIDMSEIDKVIRENDIDKDGKLSLEEFEKSAERDRKPDK